MTVINEALGVDEKVRYLPVGEIETASGYNNTDRLID